MARSGTIEGSILNGNYKLRISWTATQNVTANTSTITAKLYLVQAASWSLNIGSRASSYNSCTIAGVKQAFTSPAINNGGGATTLLGTVSQTVAHNADGTKSVAISGVYGIRATISGTWYEQITASGTITLDTILRGSSVSAGAASVAIGQTLQINVNRLANAHTHYLYYTLGAQKGTIATGVTTGYAWALPMTLCNALPSSTSGNLTIYCDTYNGSTYIDTSSVRVTVTVPASVAPSVTGCTIREAADGIPDGWDVYLSGISRLNVNAAAAGVYGSTIASYQITVNGATYASNQFTTGILTGSGAKTVSVTCTDTRGRKATKAFGYTVAEYYRPMLGGVSVKRVDGNGAESDEGEYANITVSAYIAPVNGKNSGTLTLAYKAKSDGDWTTIGTYNVADVLDIAETISGISTDLSYDVSVTLTDALYTSSVSADIETATPTMDFKANGQGIAFGKVSEYDAFECAMPAIFKNTFSVDGGLNPTHNAGVTAIASSDGAGQYIKLFSFPIAAGSGWNYSSLVLSFEECIFGVFSGTLDVHIRNSASSSTVSQQIFACRDCRGNPYHFNFYLSIENNVASVYWLCRSNYYGISVRVINGYMPYAGFGGITWDGTTKTTTAPGGTLCAFMGSTQTSGVWRYRENADTTREAWGKYIVSDIACDVALGGMYRTAVITLPDYPVAFSSAPTVQISWTNAGYGAFVWPTSQGTATAPPTIYLVRPTTGTLSGTINIYANG